jgi:hypothetical protein
MVGSSLYQHEIEGEYLRLLLVRQLTPSNSPCCEDSIVGAGKDIGIGNLSLGVTGEISILAGR